MSEAADQAPMSEAADQAPVSEAADQAPMSEAADQAPTSATSKERSDDRDDKQNDRYSLQVKSEFVTSERPESLGPLPPREDNNDEVRISGKERLSGKQRKKRGRNKKRPRDARQDNSEKICMSVIRGIECPFGEEACKYSHDMVAYMATRPSDIKEFDDGICPVFKSQGYCVYGAMCRFGSSHMNKTGGNMHKNPSDLPEGKPVNPLPDTALNILPKEIQHQLRKKQYPFACKRHFESAKDSTGAEQPENEELKTDASSHTPVELKTRKIIDFSNKVYVAPLTTVGNLPFRRIMKKFGADITCGEMAVATQLLEGKNSEWALLKRHPDEDIFGIQVAGAHPDQYTRVAEVIEKYATCDFLDLNLGCPLDLICQKGAGAALMMKERKLKGVLEGISQTVSCPITVKIRTGWDMNKPFAHKLVPKIQSWGIDGVAAIMIHGRSRLQRYQLLSNWDYISEVANSQSTEMLRIPIIGNGDIFSYTDHEEKTARDGLSSTAMIGRGALIKPWLPTEIKERRHWDISASERLDILKNFVRFGLEHWGADQHGVNNTRRFLLEWLSFLYRYVPVGLLEVIPQQMNQRPPAHMTGRNDLETLFMSPNSHDWVKISEMLLGPVAEDFKFLPKHKASGYA